MPNKNKYQDFIKAGAPELPKGFFYKIHDKVNNPDRTYGIVVTIYRRMFFGLFLIKIGSYEKSFSKRYDSGVEITTEHLVKLAKFGYERIPDKFKYTNSELTSSVDHWKGKLG